MQVRNGIPNEGVMRLAYRSAYVVLIAFIACTIPFFGDLMGFFGALGNGPTSFWMLALPMTTFKLEARYMHVRVAASWGTGHEALLGVGSLSSCRR